MKTIEVLALVLGAACTTIAQSAYYGAQPTPMPCLGDACVDPAYNILRYQDNTIIRRPDNTYFRFSKGDNPGDGINVATSNALIGPWILNFTILGQLSDIEGSDCVSGSRYKGYNFSNSDLNRWAPEIHYIDDQYYLFYTVEDQAKGYCFDQCVATSPSMDDGTWTDHGTMSLPDNDIAAWRRIDGNILSDSSDPQGVLQPYMAFGSFQYGIYGIQLNSDYLTAVQGVEPTLLIKAQDQGVNNAYSNETEGAYQLRNNGYIYLFYSRGSCCSGGNVDPTDVYRTQVCRTSESTPAGPYVDRDGVSCTNGPMTRQGSTIMYPVQPQEWEPGSVSVILDPTEGLVMTYQYTNLSRTDPGPFLGWGWNYLTWGSDGWPVLTQSRS